MSKDRFVERQMEVSKATARLGEAAVAPEGTIVRDAVIQRFEFSFELVWKTLKLYLERQGHECGGPRPTLKKAFADGLIPTPEEADVWFQMLEDRNLTSHAYDEALAARIYRNVVRDYSPLLSSMSARIQTLEWE
jgi:nucleotidyltransferase substrate binding protein (TIGR01987 family)